MAANITEKDGMFYYGDVPWHGLGTKVDKVATSAEAIEAAGLDWRVEKEPVFIRTNGILQKIGGKFALKRQDTDVIGK